jgi:hypothetical protein
MNMIEIKQYVDRLFKANRKKSHVCDIPIVGGHYVPTEDNVRPLKKIARAALAACEWFNKNGPADLQPLPLSMDDREALKTGEAPHILAWFARSLEALDYNYLEHPSFWDYACGVMASEHAPKFIQKEHLLKRFPPRPLDGLGPGLYWQPPEQHARTMESWGRSLEREARARAAFVAHDAGGTACRS